MWKKKDYEPGISSNLRTDFEFLPKAWNMVLLAPTFGQIQSRKSIASVSVRSAMGFIFVLMSYEI